ncbi:hypothetical protein B0T20DRAFT_109720 [Sordaria brevicollis]|uniref:Uncharacterized protein n=1 Tax=Sordaria brevicollis TaxID=83679 RepID=A0AAE0NVC5_SORBR|nr:hypothetical protein B0T20DRAFT_109720 [Sordaria brevicollis]
MAAEMDAEVADDILARVAQDGTMDYSCWPKLLPIVVSRIEKIAHTEFPIPHIPWAQQPARPSSPRFIAPLPSSSDPIDTPRSSQEASNKENDAPTSAPRPPGDDNVASSPPKAPSPVPNTTTTEPSQPQQPVLPVPVAEMLHGVTSHLTTNFPDYPPHTIQRLAELVLKPRPQYRSVVGYLNALDRVVHVTSGANLYPLPPAIPDLSGMGGMSNGGGPDTDNGSASLSSANNIGSDEALGGALLTPIPWLTRKTNGDGGDDDGSISDAGSSSPLSASGASDPSTQHEQQQRALAQQHSHITFAQSSVSPQVRKESTEMIEGPNGMGSIETVSISVNGIPSTGAGGHLLGLSQQPQRGVTQGELLRQEQRAGVVPVSQVSGNTNSDSSSTTPQGYTAAQTTPLSAAPHGEGSSTTAPPADEDIVMGENSDPEEEQQDEEVPHARGPQEIGPEDTGPQTARSSIAMSHTGEVDMKALDVEAAVGRRLQSPPATGSAPTDTNTSPSKSGDSKDLVPQSPKREAEDDSSEAGSSQKRQRTETEDKTDSNMNTAEASTSSTTEEATKPESSEVPKASEATKQEEPKKDEEDKPAQKEEKEDEDMVLVDRPAPTNSHETPATAPAEEGESSKGKETEASGDEQPKSS